jgi:hypothetical protein
MSRFSDEELTRLVSETTAADREVPPEWREAARAAYTWRNVDQELLALTHDSLVEAGAAVRGEGDTRTLEFAGGGLTLEVELSGPRVSGQLGPAVAGEVVLEAADGSRRSTTTDDSGFFVIDGVDGGVARFTVRVGEQLLATEWIPL